MARILGIISTILFSTTLSNFSYACDIAPEYLEDEKNIFSVGTTDLIANSTYIFSGNFSKNSTAEELTVSVQNPFKSADHIKLVGNVEVIFFDVKNYFVESGKELEESSDEKNLKSQIEFGGHKYGGWGGLLSGIFHSSDCERSVFIYTDQEYLFFLDEKKVIRARFPLNSSIEKLLPALQQKIDTLSYLPERK